MRVRIASVLDRNVAVSVVDDQCRHRDQLQRTADIRTQKRLPESERHAWAHRCALEGPVHAALNRALGDARGNQAQRLPLTPALYALAQHPVHVDPPLAAWVDLRVE